MDDRSSLTQDRRARAAIVACEGAGRSPYKANLGPSWEALRPANFLAIVSGR